MTDRDQAIKEAMAHISAAELELHVHASSDPELKQIQITLGLLHDDLNKMTET